MCDDCDRQPLPTDSGWKVVAARKPVGLHVRRAQASDAPVLARVHVDSWQAAYRGLVPEATLKRFTHQWREECYRESLAKDAEETYLVEVGDGAVAFLTIGAGRDSNLDVSRTGEIWGIYIVPDFWRRGIGRRLVGEAEAMLTSRGYEDAVLWVLEGNERARGFYEAMGYRLDGESKDMDWGTPLVAVRYRKVLKAVDQVDGTRGDTGRDGYVSRVV